jgi:hypothetical protein
VTVLDATGNILQQRAVGNEVGDLRRWARSLPRPAQLGNGGVPFLAATPARHGVCFEESVFATG